MKPCETCPGDIGCERDDRCYANETIRDTCKRLGINPIAVWADVVQRAERHIWRGEVTLTIESEGKSPLIVTLEHVDASRAPLVICKGSVRVQADIETLQKMTFSQVSDRAPLSCSFFFMGKEIIPRFDAACSSLSVEKKRMIKFKLELLRI